MGDDGPPAAKKPKIDFNKAVQGVQTACGILRAAGAFQKVTIIVEFLRVGLFIFDVIIFVLFFP